MTDRREPRSDPSYVAPAAGCAADVLRYLAMTPGPVSIAEISRGVGANRSMVFRTVKELEKRELVACPEEGRYWLGLGILEIGGAFAAKAQYATSMERILRDLASRTGATATMAVLRGFEVVYIMRQAPPGSVGFYTHIGLRRPANCTALGKALLADMSDAEVDLRFGGTYPVLTSRSIATAPRLHQDLAEVRERGYSIERGEAIVGRCCLGVRVAISGLDLVAVSISLDEESFEQKEEALTGCLLEVRQTMQREDEARRALSDSSTLLSY
jgi:DNA-binding IclR family transcriptional regulator